MKLRSWRSCGGGDGGGVEEGEDFSWWRLRLLMEEWRNEVKWRRKVFIGFGICEGVANK